MCSRRVVGSDPPARGSSFLFLVLFVRVLIKTLRLDTPRPGCGVPPPPPFWWPCCRRQLSLSLTVRKPITNIYFSNFDIGTGLTVGSAYSHVRSSSTPIGTIDSLSASFLLRFLHSSLESVVSGVGCLTGGNLFPPMPLWFYKTYFLQRSVSAFLLNPRSGCRHSAGRVRRMHAGQHRTHAGRQG